MKSPHIPIHTASTQILPGSKHALPCKLKDNTAQMTTNSKTARRRSHPAPQSPRDIKSACSLIQHFRSRSVLSPLIIVTQVAHLLGTNSLEPNYAADSRHARGPSPTWRENVGFALERNQATTPQVTTDETSPLEFRFTVLEVISLCK